MWKACNAKNKRNETCLWLADHKKVIVSLKWKQGKEGRHKNPSKKGLTVTKKVGLNPKSMKKMKKKKKKLRSKKELKK